MINHPTLAEIKRLERAPRGKIIHIGCEEFEVWPWRCVDGHRCIQCFFTGKTGCAPRFWRLPTKPTEMTAQGSKSFVELHNPIISLDAALPSGEGTLYDYFAARPLVPLNDGGFTEEMTERINVLASQLTGTPEPYRITDEPCPGCGYQYSLPWGTRNGKQRYRCPQCGKYWEPCPRGIPSGMKEFARKLRRDGLSLKAIRLKVEEAYHKKPAKSTIHQWVHGRRGKPIGGERSLNK
ncbi:hypothetical protein ES703_37358 [subsurface metagenome]